MNELSVEEKAQRYDEAIERGKQIQNTPYTAHFDIMKEVAEHLLPELKESEDERIRKELIDLVRHSVNCMPADKFNERIAWLEKKGEQKPADKAEPKFKVGDWLVHKNIKGVFCITQITSNYYLTNIGSFITFGQEDNYRPWTIQDAKEGDALAFNDGHGNDCIELIKSITDKKIEFWFCLTNSNRYEVFDGSLPYTNLASRKDATPATKEQRDLLFQKMQEAGYEWDAEKKKLKKIEDEPDRSKGCNNVKGCVACVDGSELAHIEEHKPAWSEEDEEELEIVVKHLLKAGQYDSADWLKSLKERVQSQSQWKPSKGQMGALANVCNGKILNLDHLNSLYQDLKKLWEE